MRLMEASMYSRTSLSNVRTFSLIVASSGMMFSLVPACSDPMVSTALSGAHLLHGKLGMLVQILVDAFQLRQQRAAAAPECLGEWVHGRLPAWCACATVPHSVAACHHRPRSMRKTLLAAHECRWGQAAQRDAAGNARSDAKLGDQEDAADRRSGA